MNRILTFEFSDFFTRFKGTDPFANVEELKTMPSVGDASAQDMVYFRAVNGNTTAENLVTTKFVIGPGNC